MRRVEHLVPVGRDLPEEPIEVSLGLRREEELGLFHQDDDTGEPGLPPRFQPRHEPVRRRPAGRVGPCRFLLHPAERGTHDRDHRMGLRPRAGGSDERAVPQAGGEEHGGRTVRTLARALGRFVADRDRGAVRELADDPDRSLVVASDVGCGERGGFGSRSAQMAARRFDFPVLGSPTIAAIEPGRKLVSRSDRKRRTWTPVSPKSATRRC